MLAITLITIIIAMSQYCRNDCGSETVYCHMRYNNVFSRLLIDFGRSHSLTHTFCRCSRNRFHFITSCSYTTATLIEEIKSETILEMEIVFFVCIQSESIRLNFDKVVVVLWLRSLHEFRRSECRVRCRVQQSMLESIATGKCSSKTFECGSVNLLLHTDLVRVTQWQYIKHLIGGSCTEHSTHTHKVTSGKLEIYYVLIEWVRWRNIA